FVRSEHRTAQNDKFSPLVRGALTGFPVSKLHISPGQKKTDLGRCEKGFRKPDPHSAKRAVAGIAKTLGGEAQRTYEKAWL
ncbi:hypothetical protein, partial [Escherichia coli]|uniref:hypothetical protein n=1 Tax=Escherichia coli TaxID=562 RepID=UPI003EDF3983